MCLVWCALRYLEDAFDKMFDDAYILIRILGIRGFIVGCFSYSVNVLSTGITDQPYQGGLNNLPVFSGMKGFEVEVGTSNNN